jgi:hypothetical protein
MDQEKFSALKDLAEVTFKKMESFIKSISTTPNINIHDKNDRINALFITEFRDILSQVHAAIGTEFYKKLVQVDDASINLRISREEEEKTSNFPSLFNS